MQQCRIGGFDTFDDFFIFKSLTGVVATTTKPKRFFIFIMEILLKSEALENANHFFSDMPKEVSDLIQFIIVDREIPKTEITLCNDFDANNIRIIQEYFATLPDDWGISFYEPDNLPF